MFKEQSYPKSINKAMVVNKRNNAQFWSGSSDLTSPAWWHLSLTAQVILATCKPPPLLQGTELEGGGKMAVVSYPPNGEFGNLPSHQMAVVSYPPMGSLGNFPLTRWQW